LQIFLIGHLILTNVVVDFGDGPVHLKRILPSGSWPTAHYGSIIHSMMDYGYRYKQTLVVNSFMQEVRRRHRGFEDNADDRVLERSYIFFQQGESFVHHSDDCATLVWMHAIALSEMVDRNLYFSSLYGLIFKVNTIPEPDLDYAGDALAILRIVKRFKMEDFMICNSNLYGGSQDGKYEGRMWKNPGQIEFVERFDYLTRVRNWGKIHTEIDPKTGMVLRKGLNFLKFYILVVTQGGLHHLFPHREPPELFAKLTNPSRYYTHPNERMGQIKSIGELATRVPAIYQLFVKLYDWVAEKYNNGVKELSMKYLQKTAEEHYRRVGERWKPGKINGMKSVEEAQSFYLYRRKTKVSRNLYKAVKQLPFKMSADKIYPSDLTTRPFFTRRPPWVAK